MSKTMEGNDSKTKTECMGYKDREKALYTLKCLSDRDISYQHRVITHYHTSARKILKITKDETKKGNIREAIGVYDEWLQDYKDNNRRKTNLSYLPMETIEAFMPLAKSYGISDTEFYEVYKAQEGNYKAMRSVETKNDEGTTWDIERNKRLKEIINNIESSDLKWWTNNEDEQEEYPSKEHLECILLAYSPDKTKLKALEAEISKLPKSPEADEEKKKKVTKRSRESSGDASEEESVKKAPKKQAVSENPEEPSGLGFKDKEKALRSIRFLEGRDISYQYHALTGLIKRAARVISCTKDEQKIKNMKEAVEVLENWVTDYNVNHRSRENFGYLALKLVKAYEDLAKKYDLEIPGFRRAYENVGGDYKKLRAVKVPGQDITWDIERNRQLRSITENIQKRHEQWFETEAPLRGLPTKEHVECIMWGFSHEPSKLEKTLKLLKEKLDTED